jgi:hypothetical protein
MRTDIELSRMDTRAGRKTRVTVNSHSPSWADRPGVFLGFEEDGAHLPYALTPEEAEAMGRALIAGAAETRKAFAELDPQTKETP